MEEYTTINSIYHQPPQLSTYAAIMLPNGTKCNINFYWECVVLGILPKP